MLVGRVQNKVKAANQYYAVSVLNVFLIGIIALIIDRVAMNMQHNPRNEVKAILEEKLPP